MTAMLGLLNWDGFARDLLLTAIVAAAGIIVLIFGYKVFDWILRRVDFDAELNKGNIAVAIVAGTMILALAVIIHAAIAAIFS